jgi:aspartate racemase
MKKIGLIGGLSWVSTAQYYKRINEITQSALGGVSSARIVLESINRQEFISSVIERKDEASACQQIAESAAALEAAGADFIVISCNGAHRFVPEIAKNIQIPFLHIAQVTAQAIAEKGFKRAAILGVRKTMEEDFYPSILAQNGIGAIIPNEQEKEYIHESINRELVHNQFLDKTRIRYQSIISDLSERGADCVALACTEIPLLLSPEQSPIPAFSTTEIHCLATVKCALEND